MSVTFWGFVWRFCRNGRIRKVSKNFQTRIRAQSDAKVAAAAAASMFLFCNVSWKISSKICSRKPFFGIRFRFLLRTKNVKKKKSNFRENFVFIPKICGTLFNVEYYHSRCEKSSISANLGISNIILRSSYLWQLLLSIKQSAVKEP